MSGPFVVQGGRVGDFLGALGIAFMIGAIPFGVVVSRLFFGTDIRASGSGNIGAANALRSLGAKGGAAVLLLDALKGFVPTYVAMSIAWFTPAGASAIALATVLGHCYSPFLRFKGGKGVATFLGAVFALSWPVGLIFIAVWLLTFRIWGFASLASLAACAATPGALLLTGSETGVAVLATLAFIVIVLKHRTNIERLRAGTESKLRLGGRPAEPQRKG